MNTIARTRRFVKKHKTVIVFGAGALVGAAVVIHANRSEEDSLGLPDGAINRMRETGEALFYRTDAGDLLLMPVPQK